MGQKLAGLLLCVLLGAHSLYPNVMAQIDTDSSETEGAGGGAGEGESSTPKVGDFMFGATFDVIMVRRHSAVARANGLIQLDCMVSAPGRFRAWVKDGIVIGTEPSLKVRQDEPNLFGIYYCAADPAVAPQRYRALQFVISDMPPADKTSETSVQPNQDITLTCKLTTGSGRYKWYKYNDMAYKFEEMSGQTGKQLSLPYNTLNRDKGSGFTYYKCADPSDPTNYAAFKVEKDPSRQLIDGRMTNVFEQSMRALPTDVASVPIAVTPKSKVTFECHKVNPTDNTKWYFRDNNTVSPGRYEEMRTSGGVEIQENPESSVLSVKDCDVKNKGYYRCNVGGVVKYAFLDIRVIVPTIHDYGKGIYDLSKNPGADNELECEIPIGGELKDVIWRIVPSDGSAPFDIPVNSRVRDFETSIKDSSSNQLVTIKFRDNPQLHNYRLECRLGDEFDHVNLRSEQPVSIRLEVEDYTYPGYKQLRCTFDKRLREIKFHINDEKNDPPGPGLAHHRIDFPNGNAMYFFRVSKPNSWFRCSGRNPETAALLYSEPVPLVKNPLMLDIKIDGAPMPKGAEPTIARVEGRSTEFACNFSNYKDLRIAAENVKLVFEGRLMSNTPVQTGPGTFKFVIDNPKPNMSGKYFCLHSVNTPGQNVRSIEVTINWCGTDKFLCDSRCREKNIVCNGVRDCADGTDELPSLCSPCEPNEVACKDWKGVRPARGCVLKHWLCDGTDDCENGYDEESPLSKEWCTNTCVSKPWLNCPGSSTCCKSNDKCILRAYECDGEVDCGAGEDESTCCSLTLTDPTRRQVVEQAVGTRITLTCRAVGSERPTISWRCNWGKLRDEARMKESNRVVRKNDDNTYEVEGTLVIENFTKADECLYNCEAVSKCKRQMSPEFEVKVGTGVNCSKTCGIGGECRNNVCQCKANVEGPNCDRCKRGYHSLTKDHPDGCVSCFCSDRSDACEAAGLFFEEKKIGTIENTAVRLMGWGLYGVYEEGTSHEKVAVDGGQEIAVSQNNDPSRAPRDDDESYVFLTTLAGKRLASYGGKLSFTVRANVPMDTGLTPDTTFPVFGIKGWRGQTLVYWDRSTNRAAETRYSVTLDEQNLRAIDGSRATRYDVMTALTDLRGVFFRVYHFAGQSNARILDIKYEEATATSGRSPAPVEKCTACPDPYQGAFCEECKTDSDYHKIIDYNSTVNRWKCVPCKEGYQNAPQCNQCEEGFADKIIGRRSGQKPDCEEYVLPTVEPETLNIPSGRTVVLTCLIRRQKQGYNGTAWLLEWQSVTGQRLRDSPRVFQVRSESSSRLVIKDASPADTGRYRCEGYNRRSGPAFAFANLTVNSRSVKKVMLQTETTDPDTTTIRCALVAKEPSRANQFRATLTHQPFPINRQSEKFETVKWQTGDKNFSGVVTFDMKNDQDTGYWTCHISDLFSNYTVSRRIPVILKPQQSFNWDLKAPVNKIERPVGSTVRLKCNKVIRSPNQVTIPIDWSFVPVNKRAAKSVVNPLGAPNQTTFSTMDEVAPDVLPPGASRDGDDLVLNPLAIEHWGTFSCQRQGEAPSRSSRKSSGRSLKPLSTDSYESKQASIEVIPSLIGSKNINVDEGASISLSCMPTSGNLDDDGLPCHQYSWVFKSQKTARQLQGRRGGASRIVPLLASTGVTHDITNADQTNSGIYYCRCHTFFRPDREVQFSKVMEYNVFVSALEELPPRIQYTTKETTFIDKKPQWLYCYDEEARPPSKVWWEVWNNPATSLAGVGLAGEGREGNRSFSNITFIMDKHVHQVFFTCNAKNDVAHKTRIINMRFESTDYDPLRLKIIVQSTYEMLNKVQDASHAVTDRVYAPMDQFNLTGEGYRDNVVILCHMTGNPYGTDLELLHDDPTSPSDVPNLIKQCSNMKKVANVVYCNVTRYWDYVNYKWTCQAKQQNPETKAIETYKKNLQFEKVPSKIKIRFSYYRKWYDYDERNLKFYVVRGGVALIRCSADYYENGRLSTIPFPHVYEFYVSGQDGLPHYAKQNGNTLSISDIPIALHNKEIICFVRPQNKSDIAKYGFGQRYFTISVFTMPERPSILVTMQDKDDKSMIIRNPTEVELVRNGPATELTCTLLNMDTEVDKNTESGRYLDWVKCKNYECNYEEADKGTETRVSSMEKRLEGDKAVLRVQTSSVKNSGIFMCVAIRPFVNMTGDKDLSLQHVPVKVMVKTKPGEGDDSTVYGRMTVQRTPSGDIEFDCFFVGFPYPDLEMTRHSTESIDVRLENPRWIRVYEGTYFDDKDSFRYGSQLKYRLPKENVAKDGAKGTYVCSAENSLGKATAEQNWEG